MDQPIYGCQCNGYLYHHRISYVENIIFPAGYHIVNYDPLNAHNSRFLGRGVYGKQMESTDYASSRGWYDFQRTGWGGYPGENRWFYAGDSSTNRSSRLHISSAAYTGAGNNPYGDGVGAGTMIEQALMCLSTPACKVWLQTTSDLIIFSGIRRAASRVTVNGKVWDWNNLNQVR